MQSRAQDHWPLYVYTDFANGGGFIQISDTLATDLRENSAPLCIGFDRFSKLSDPPCAVSVSGRPFRVRSPSDQKHSMVHFDVDRDELRLRLLYLRRSILEAQLQDPHQFLQTKRVKRRAPPIETDTAARARVIERAEPTGVSPLQKAVVELLKKTTDSDPVSVTHSIESKLKDSLLEDAIFPFVVRDGDTNLRLRSRGEYSCVWKFVKDALNHSFRELGPSVRSGLLIDKFKHNFVLEVVHHYRNQIQSRKSSLPEGQSLQPCMRGGKKSQSLCSSDGVVTCKANE